METRSNPTGAGAFRLGRGLFGVAVAGSGAQQIVTGDFVRLVSGGAADPGWSIGPVAVGVILVGAGFAIAANRAALVAGIVVAGLLLASLVFAQAPRLLGNPSAFFMWTNPLKAVALLGSAFLLAAGPGAARGDASSPSMAGRSRSIAVLFLAVFLFVCGVQHFVYAEFVTALVPSWIPGQGGLTYLTGAALMAGGAGLLVPRTSRLAAALSALMIFLWVLMLHIPRAVGGPDHAGECAGVFEALAMSGIALMAAAARR